MKGNKGKEKEVCNLLFAYKTWKRKGIKKIAAILCLVKVWKKERKS